MTDQENFQISTALVEQKPSAKSVLAKLREKGTAALEKGSAVAGQLSALLKGNVDAVSVSGKALGAGLKEIGQDSVADGRQAIQVVVADVKEMAALRSPKEILALQGKLASRNLQSIKGFATKNGKALRALAGVAVAPVASRIQENIAAVRKAA